MPEPFDATPHNRAKVEPVWRISKRLRKAQADDYAEPLAGMIRRGEIEPPDEFVIEDLDV